MIDILQIEWDRDFERVVGTINHLPPSLLEGLLCHVVRALYGRGVLGSRERNIDKPGQINGSASRIVRSVERQLRDEIASNGRHNSSGGRTLDVPIHKAKISRQKQLPV